MSAGADDVVEALRRNGVHDVDASDLARAMYSTDASVYRVQPLVVVRPQHTDELSAVLAVAREMSTPVTMRGAGTSIAGNAVGTGIVVDTSRHLNRVLDLDVEARTATVQPGTVHATLQRVAAAHGLRFGPDPSTHTRCTVGGMIGNNACGSRALGYGRTAENVVALEAVTASGDDASTRVAALTELADRHLGDIRPRFGRFSRQVSGYAMEHLLPENERSLDRFLVGSEGTLAVVTAATVRLVADAPGRVLAVLGYPSMAEAADAVPGLLVHQPVACEGMDERIPALVSPRPELPAGRGWLMVELTGTSAAEALSRAQRVVADSGATDHRVVTDTVEQLALWRIREDGAGLASRATQPPGQSGWEDAAVPPESLGAYLRDFRGLLSGHGLHGVPYGHFGEGCVHVRIDFALANAEGRRRYRAFVEEAARLAASYGGSMSGEHGDGRARSALLPVMYDDVALGLFAEVKRIFDPDNLLNPGVLVDPAPFDADIRLAGATSPSITTLELPEDGGSLVDAVHRCTGVGKCLADNTGVHGVMCPSFQATRDEKDSTRGRARVLQDLVTGRLPGGARSPAVEEALDLCLACKGCARDCPTGVDMAAYKAEWLHERYAGKRRPLTHYTLGRLPAALARVPARVASSGLSAGRLASMFAGVDRRRSLPRPARRPVSASPLVDRSAPADVTLWVDTFTNRFAPEAAEAAVRVLEAHTGSVQVLAYPDECCGLTWMSTGQLEQARDRLSRLMSKVESDSGDAPIVVLEPSCLAMLRRESGQLLPDGSGLVGRLFTLAEHLSTPGRPGWAPDLSGVEIVAQPHCHHASVLGWQADESLLRSTGAQLTRVGGCCGLAGDWGMEKGHYDVSVAVFEHDLGPAVRAAGPDAVVLADGFSCRTQLADLAGVRALTLAELLASHLAPG